MVRKGSFYSNIEGGAYNGTAEAMCCRASHRCDGSHYPDNIPRFYVGIRGDLENKSTGVCFLLFFYRGLLFPCVLVRTILSLSGFGACPPHPPQHPSASSCTWVVFYSKILKKQKHDNFQIIVFLFFVNMWWH
jgi:hypothetical protein